MREKMLEDIQALINELKNLQAGLFSGDLPEPEGIGTVIRFSLQNREKIYVYWAARTSDTGPRHWAVTGYAPRHTWAELVGLMCLTDRPGPVCFRVVGS